MLHQFITYFNWLPKTIHLHGIHSPFVFQLEKNCLRQPLSKNTQTQFKTYKKKLAQDQRTITVTDFGSGSRVVRSNNRKVRHIARYAGASLKRMGILHSLSSYTKAKTILELGTSLGTGTLALATPHTTTITTLEGCPATAAVAKQYLKEAGCTTINSTVGAFDQTIKDLISQSFDLIYFDGNHDKEATLCYVQHLLSTVHNDTIWIFDDIHWSAGMSEAWELIKTLPQITVTIDCFWFGLVFFRKEQNKQDFCIRL